LKRIAAPRDGQAEGVSASEGRAAVERLAARGAMNGAKSPAPPSLGAITALASAWLTAAAAATSSK
jgi:hypothetical protein